LPVIKQRAQTRTLRGPSSPEIPDIPEIRNCSEIILKSEIVPKF